MRALDVRLGPVRVGLLERLAEWDYRFSFDPAWLADPRRPVLGQLFEDRRPGEIESAGHVPCWFLHLLPQSPLRRAIARSASVDPDDDFDLLALLGEDLPGAVVMVPGTPRLTHPGAVAPIPMFPATAPDQLRFSLAGAQWKLSVRQGERGLTIPVRGETGSWIAKFHDPQFQDLPRVELATTRWAEHSGVIIPRSRQANVSEFANLPDGLPTGDGTVFLIERFDRGTAGERIHIEDFAQVIDRPPGDPQYQGRYEDIAAILAYLAPRDMRAYCERLVFCILCGNTDAHLKNWSLIYHDKRTPSLSPAYDLVASVLYAPEKISDELALTLGESRHFEDIEVDSFRLLASVSGHSFDDVAAWVRAAAERVRDAWHQEAAHQPWNARERTRIEKHMARVSLGRR